jgi:hypothetical protein
MLNIVILSVVMLSVLASRLQQWQKCYLKLTQNSFQIRSRKVSEAMMTNQTDYFAFLSHDYPLNYINTAALSVQVPKAIISLRL